MEPYLGMKLVGSVHLGVGMKVADIDKSDYGAGF